jgi:lipoprotein-anchoring transpeptidase ErfK/SrfK
MHRIAVGRIGVLFAACAFASSAFFVGAADEKAAAKEGKGNSNKTSLPPAEAIRHEKANSTRNRLGNPANAYDPATLNDSMQPVPTAKRGAPILRAQILLSRSGFSVGEMDAAAGRNFSRALSAFQTARDLPVSGNINEATWKALNADAGPVIVPYTLTAEDVDGPFAPVPDDMMEMAKAKTLGYETLEEKLAERFHVSIPTLKRLNPGKEFTAGTEIQVPDLTRPTGAEVVRILVTKATSSVAALDADGKPVRFYVASTGSSHDPLPIGDWKITLVARDPVFHYNPELFWDADPAHSKAKIQPGPNNPVGPVWIDLTKEHYGIHGTPNPATVGHSQSHGCIRLTNWDAVELAGLVKKGMLVQMREK